MSEFEAEAEAKGFIDLSDVADEQLVIGTGVGLSLLCWAR